MQNTPRRKFRNITIHQLQLLLGRYSTGPASGCERVANAMRRSHDDRRIYQPDDHEGHSGPTGAVARKERAV